MSRKVKVNAMEMQSSAREAYEKGKEELKTTRTSVKNAISSLNGLSKINQLAMEILSIANKTNLLSLNALHNGIDIPYFFIHMGNRIICAFQGGRQLLR